MCTDEQREWWDELKEFFPAHKLEIEFMRIECNKVGPEALALKYYNYKSKSPGRELLVHTVWWTLFDLTTGRSLQHEINRIINA